MKNYFSFQWHLTDVCDQRCKHCYIYADPDHQPVSISLEHMNKILDNCLDFCQRTDREPYFFITGGDPLLHPDFWNLAHALHDRRIGYTILGNPFHLSDEVCRHLKQTGCERYQLSLDGLEKTHDWFRKPGSYRITLEKIPVLKKAGIRTAIMSTVSDLNIDQIPALMDEAVAHHVDTFAFGRYCPSEASEPCMDAGRYHQFLQECDRKIRQYEADGVETYFPKKDHLWTLLDYENGNFEIPQDADPDMIYDGCHCGDCHLTILPTGELYACRRVRESRIGNALLDSIHDLWFEQMEAYRDYEAFEKCRNCELVAWCRGCPAVAKGYTGSFYGADPQCWKEISPAESEKGAEPIDA